MVGDFSADDPKRGGFSMVFQSQGVTSLRQLWIRGIDLSWHDSVTTKQTLYMYMLQGRDAKGPTTLYPTPHESLHDC